ncbi:MAG: hypothetical protein NTW21_43285, partial [Verrucomicrobia bacterium]|nr:hypothetical protein [Verrucomicrobiota bacterium]
DYRIALPHVLPTHFDEQHSLWISSRLLNGGHIEFKSKEVFDECSRAFVGMEGLFYRHDEAKGGVVKSRLLLGVIALRNAEELAMAIRQRLPANWRVVAQRILDWSAGGAVNWPQGRGVEIVIERQGFQPADLKAGRGGQVVLAVLERGYTPPDPETARAAQAGNAAYLGPWIYPGVFGMVDEGNDWPTARTDIQAAMTASMASPRNNRVAEVQDFADRLSNIMPANWEVASLEHRETGGPGWPKGDAVVIGLQRKGITAAERERRRGGTMTLAVMLGEFAPAEPVGNDQVMTARRWGACEEGHAVFAVFGDPQDWPNLEQDERGVLEAAAPPAKGAGSDKVLDEVRKTPEVPPQKDPGDSEKLSPQGGRSTTEDSVRERTLEERQRQLAALQAEIARRVFERDQRIAREQALADEMAAANQKAMQAESERCAAERENGELKRNDSRRPR